MKKIVTLLLLSTTITAFAHGPYFRPRHYHDHWGWVAPVFIGGVVGYEIARNQPPVIVQPPVVVQQQPVIVQPQPYYGQSPNCSPWKEVQTLDGNIYRERTCTP